MNKTKNHFGWTCLKLMVGGAILLAASWPMIFPQSVPEPESRSSLRGAMVGDGLSAAEAAQIHSRMEVLVQRLQATLDNGDLVHPPATEFEIQQIESMVGVKLPADYRAFLSICNGIPFEAGVYPQALTTTQMRTSNGYPNDVDWMEDGPLILEIDPARKPGFQVEIGMWHPAFLRIIDMDGGGHLINLETGRILSWDHDGWWFACRADSFEQFLIENLEKFEKDSSRKIWE